LIERKGITLEIARWAFWWASLVGPIYFILIVGLFLGRRFFSDVHVLFEINETITMIAASTLSAAITGLILILV
jgi:hypothetical protein